MPSQSTTIVAPRRAQFSTEDKVLQWLSNCKETSSSEFDDIPPYLKDYAKKEYYAELSDREKRIYLKGIRDVVRRELAGNGGLLTKSHRTKRLEPFCKDVVFVNLGFWGAHTFKDDDEIKLVGYHIGSTYRIKVMLVTSEGLKQVANVLSSDVDALRLVGDLDRAESKLLYQCSAVARFCVTIY